MQSFDEFRYSNECQSAQGLPFECLLWLAKNVARNSFHTFQEVALDGSLLSLFILFYFGYLFWYLYLYFYVAVVIIKFIGLKKKKVITAYRLMLQS